MIRFRKVFGFGPFRSSISKSGLGFSWGLPGLRIGISPDGRKYLSIGIPGTGLYMIKYFNKSDIEASLLNTEEKKQEKSVQPWWKQKGLLDK